MMKAIRNDSLQGLEMYFKTPKGVKSFWVLPGQVKVVPVSFIGKQIKGLHSRRLVTISDYKE